MYIAFVILASFLVQLTVGALALHCHNSLAIDQEMNQRYSLAIEREINQH
jgi:hypothetical protein